MGLLTHDVKTYKCKACLEEFPRTLEYFYSNGKNGMRNSCKKCKLSRKVYSSYRSIKVKPDTFECRTCKLIMPFTSEYFYEDEKCKFKLHYQCIDCCRQYSRVMHFKRYNMDYNDLVSLKESKNCFICKKESNLVVDHDHRTGQVRGMLCQSCNKGLGHFFDNPNVIQAASEYLRKWDC